PAARDRRHPGGHHRGLRDEGAGRHDPGPALAHRRRGAPAGARRGPRPRPRPRAEQRRPRQRRRRLLRRHRHHRRRTAAGCALLRRRRDDAVAAHAFAQRHHPVDHLRAQAHQAAGVPRGRARALSRRAGHGAADMSTSAASTATAVVVGESLVDVLGADRVPGGSPLNVAVGLARLGVPTTLLTQLGADADGDLVRAHAEASGVAVRAQPVPRTGTAVATVDDDGSADYAFDIAWTWDPRSGPAPAADLFHCGSLAAFLTPGAAGVDALLAEAADRGALTSFDPNIRRS